LTIAQAFDSVAATCTLLPDTLAWQGFAFTVDVDGCRGRRTFRGRCSTLTPAGLRAALANVVRDYCAVAAAEIVGGADATPN
jgi:hypothetical protein